MKISSFLKQVVKQIDVKPLPARATPRSAQLRSDGFEAPAARKPISLGKVPAVSMGAEGEFVKGLYRDLLKREPDVDGFMSHLRGLENGMSRDDIKNVFLNSPEYQALQAKEAEPATAPGASGDAAKWQSVGPVPLEGYDATKLNNLDHQTVKYQFGRVASHFGLEGVKSKEDAEALLKKMVPDLKAAGLDVQEVKGDKIRVATELGQEWVDVVRGAGSGNPGWWWGSEGKAIAGTEGTTPPRQQLPRGPGAPAVPTEPTGPASPGTIREPGAPLSTVPLRPEYAAAPIDTSSGPAAARSAAQWVKDTYPQLFGRGDDRQIAFEVMTHVLGAMRAHGFDAHRVVNHPSIPVGSGQRYGSDALVVGGQIYDVYGAFGDPGRSDVQLLNPGPYEAGRLRE